MNNDSLSVSADCYSFGYLCAAKFDADADIRGWGVASAFIITSSITIVAAAFSSIFPAQCAWYRFQQWRHSNYVSAHAPTQGLPQELFPWGYAIYQVTHEALRPLRKLQLTTGTAIVITGFVDFANTTYYHRQLIITYWQLTLNSYWAADSLEYSLDHNRFESPASRTSDSQWDWWSRKILEVGVFTSVVMASIFTVFTYRAEKISWDACLSGQCYPTDRSSYTWVAGYLVYALSLFFDIFGIRFFGRSPQGWVNMTLNRLNFWLGLRCYENWREAKEQFFDTSLLRTAQVLASARLPCSPYLLLFFG